jgi:REP element-mobilizing transposase RayT
MKKHNDNKGSHLLRKGRYSSPGNYYFITASTYKKTKFFTRTEHFEIILNSLRFLEQKKRIELHFVIVMPDHIHSIFRLEQNQVLSRVMMSFKGYTGRELKKMITSVEQKQSPPHIWQDQYYDHLVRRNESYLEIMKYCLYNPVRKSLVNEPQEYRFWWSRHEIL